MGGGERERWVEILIGLHGYEKHKRDAMVTYFQRVEFDLVGTRLSLNVGCGCRRLPDAVAGKVENE